MLGPSGRLVSFSKLASASVGDRLRAQDYEGLMQGISREGLDKIVFWKNTKNFKNKVAFATDTKSWSCWIQAMALTS